jgi:hypothetical protein
MPSPIPVPDASFLGAYTRSGAFTDCYALSVCAPVTLSEFVEAFYTTRLFKLERWLIATALHIPSSDEQALQLARSQSGQFSAWRVEHRSSDEILLRAGSTRSWLCVRPQSGARPATILLFGSAVLPTRPGGRFGLAFHMLGGFHRLYSKLLLAAASRRLGNLRGARKRSA